MSFLLTYFRPGTPGKHSSPGHRGELFNGCGSVPPTPRPIVQHISATSNLIMTFKKTESALVAEVTTSSVTMLVGIGFACLYLPRIHL